MLGSEAVRCMLEHCSLTGAIAPRPGLLQIVCGGAMQLRLTLFACDRVRLAVPGANLSAGVGPSVLASVLEALDAGSRVLFSLELVGERVVLAYV